MELLLTFLDSTLGIIVSILTLISLLSAGVVTYIRRHTKVTRVKQSVKGDSNVQIAGSGNNVSK